MNEHAFLEQAAKLLDTWRPEHSPIQLEHFVVGNASHDTPWGRYVQSMRELEGRFEGWRQMEIDIHERVLDLGDARRALARLKREHESVTVDALETQERVALEARAKIAIERAELAVEADRTRRESAAREAHEIFVLAHDAHAEVGELTPERRTMLEWEFWAARFLDKIVFARIVGFPVADEVVMSLRRFPREHRAKLTYALNCKPDALYAEHAERLGLDSPECVARLGLDGPQRAIKET